MRDPELDAFMKCAKAIITCVLHQSDTGEAAAHTFKRRIRRNIMKRIDDLIKSRKQFKERFIYNKERFTTRNLAPGLVHGGMIIADYGSSDYKSRRGGVFVLFRKSYGNPHKMLIEYFTSESHKRSIEKRFNNGRIVPYSKPAWFNNQKV